MTDDRGHAERRRFFRESLARAIGPVADYLDRIAPGLSAPRPLRPPGAIDAQAFLDTCHRCGKCIEACPVHAIRWFARPGHPTDHTPVIDPSIAACVTCEGLKCTHVCPSGALLPLSHRDQINMGLAAVNANRCVRSHGEDCSACVDLCPYGETAIRLAGGGPPEVRSAGCVGCGVCQQHCPTAPKSIAVEPRQTPF